MIPAWPITQVSLRTVVFAKSTGIVVCQVDGEGQFWKVVLFLYETNTILDKVEVSPEEEHHPPDVEQARDIDPCTPSKLVHFSLLSISPLLQN